jgi:menaquinone-dependent protoporphyrinogen oxidase
MHVLVVYASHYGATKGIAERIAETLREEQLEVDLKSADEDFRHLADEEYDGYVIGSAIHAGRWLKSATDFVHDHLVTLSRQPSWLFSSGPIGEKYVHQSQPDPKEIAELRRMLDVQEHAVFAGAFDPATADLSRASWLEKQFVNRLMPVGDFRDWPAIEAWARRVARELTAVPVG